MKLDKAIETLTEILEDEDSQWEKEGSDALNLGIEALKREQKYRLPQFKGHIKLLPGETPEDEGGKP